MEKNAQKYNDSELDDVEIKCFMKLTIAMVPLLYDPNWSGKN